MRTLFLIPLIVSAITFSCSSPGNDRLKLNTGWQFLQSGETHWMPATVPGTVQSDLINLKKIQDPLIGTNEDSVQWVSERNWVYKKNFTVPKSFLGRKKNYLQFEGLDTYASVYLNDSLILTANNAFRNWEVDVSNRIKENNELLVQFKNTDSAEIIERNHLEYELPEAPRVFTRKPQFQYGWDWGPKIKTMGIWKDVNIISFNVLRIRDAYLRTKTLTDTLAEITTTITIESVETSEITVEIINETTREVHSHSLEITPQIKQYDLPLFIKTPRLWWVHNLGDPFLYDFTISIKLGNRVIDSISKKIGLRTIQLITEDDKDGQSFYFKLNGQAVYMKGANYIPQNILLTEVQDTQHNKLLEGVVNADMNMIRVWGGGIYEEDEFYSLCDEKGILVWQDFMFACAMYPGNPEFLNNVKKEAIDNIMRLRQHPSIALWCGNNENSEGWHRWGWQDNKTKVQKQEIWNNYRALFNDILPRMVDSLHPSVDYWESSPKFGRGDPRYQYEGDAHDWWVWHDGYPFEHFESNVPRFMSEFGFQSFPSYEVIHKLTGQDSLDLKHPAIQVHQKHSRGFQLINEYMKMYYPVPKSDEDYVYVSQLLQAFGITKAIYAHRRAKPYNMGTLYWQLNDCWPAISWSSIDGMGIYKALYYQSKRAFKNLIISSIEKYESIDVHIINDNLNKVSGTLRLSIQNFSGEELFKDSLEIDIPADGNEIVYKLDMKSLPYETNSTFLKINFKEEEHIHYFVKPKELSLQDKEISSKYDKTEDGFLVTLSSSTLQKDVFLHTTSNGEWTENFFDLLPGREKTLQFITNETTFKFSIKTMNQLPQNHQ